MAITAAPVAACGLLFGSNAINQVTPALSRIVNPGAAPSLLARMTVNLPGAGPVPVIGPRTISAMLNGCARIRLVNQLEFGTSSMVLIFIARGLPDSPGCPN